MASCFCVSLRFLAETFHGRRDAGVPEWPPSPLRVFQALTRAAAATSAGATLLPPAIEALTWLERQAAPTIVAPAVILSSGYRLSVPNNALDVVARAWSRGNYSNTGDASEATHRTMKPVRPMRLTDGNAVHYLWRLQDPLDSVVGQSIGLVVSFARHIVAVGWGLDLVVGNAEVLSEDEAHALSGERWYPGQVAEGSGWRAPTDGTLRELRSRHEAFLNRLGPGGFAPPPAPETYISVGYRKDNDLSARSVAAFSLLEPDASTFRAFDTRRSGLTVAGMTRHLVKRTAHRAGWSEERINGFVLGHGPRAGAKHVPVGADRFAYLPLPSIEGRGEGRARVIGNIRRVVVSSFSDQCDQEIQWARRVVSGGELIAEGSETPVAILGLLPGSDATVRHYIQRAASWATVTPVVLPGYDDPAHFRRRLRKPIDAPEQKLLLARLEDRVDGLLRKALLQAGFPEPLATDADLSWRKAGFWPGNDLADRYGVPDHLQRFPRYHVKVAWRDSNGGPLSVPGPICVGGGRFLGVGLFAAI
jgi:CRISPR-associated protein Csb2